MQGRIRSRSVYFFCEREQSWSRPALLQPVSFLHQPLQAGLIDDVIGEFFVWKHGQGGPFGSRDQFRGLFDRQVRILAYDRYHHTDHDLQAPDFKRFLLRFVGLHIFQGALFP